MSNAAEKIIEPALDRDEEKFEVTIKVHSIKHDCHVAYRLNQFEIENGYAEQIIRDMKYRLMDFIKEKLNAIGKREESQNQGRLFN